MTTKIDTSSNIYVGVNPPTGDYNDLDNRPAIDGVTLTTATTKEDLGLGSAFVYKGQKATLSDLPTSGNKKGDVWDVTEEGANYVWNGSSWDKLSNDANVKLASNSLQTVSGTAIKVSNLSDDTATNPVDKADTLTNLTATVAELNYCDGVTSNIQTQLGNKLSKDGDSLNDSDWSDGSAYVSKTISSRLISTEEGTTTEVAKTHLGWSIDPNDSENFVGDLITYGVPSVNRDNLKNIYIDVFGGIALQANDKKRLIIKKSGFELDNDATGSNYNTFSFPTKTLGNYTLATTADIKSPVYTSTDFRTATTIPSTISFSTTNPVVYYTAGTNTALTFTTFSCSDSSLSDGTYTWELICSSSNAITGTTLGSSIEYVGNDLVYNPSLAFALKSNKRTAHNFSVRLIKNGSTTKWMICYNCSFIG